MAEESTVAESELLPRHTPIWPTSARVALWLLVVLGVLVLLRNYLQPITLFLDETFILFNIVQKDVVDFAGPLDHYQIAPFGFMLAVRAAIEVFGIDEWSARLVPLLAGVLSLPLFALLIRRLCEPLPGLLILLGWSLSAEFMLQSVRVKPYTLDVLFALLGLWLGLWLLRRRCGLKETLLASLIAAVGVWFSVSFYIVLPAVGVVLLASRCGADRLRDLPALLVVAAAGLASGATHYFWALLPQKRAGDTAAYMESFWAAGFLPAPWSHPYKLIVRLEVVTGTATGLGLAGLVMALAVLGLVLAVRRRDARAWVVAMPVVFAVLASGMRVYPLEDRLVLFMGPMILVMVAWGLAGLRESFGGKLGVGVLLVAGLLMISRPLNGRAQAVFSDDVLPVFEYVREHLEPGQRVYLYYGAHNPYDFYRTHIDPGLGFDPERTIRGGHHRDDWTAYQQEVRELQHAGTDVWFIMSHEASGWGIDEGAYFTMLMDRYGQRIETHREWNAYAVLWRPTPTPAPGNNPTPGNNSDAGNTAAPGNTAVPETADDPLADTDTRTPPPPAADATSTPSD